MAYFASMPVLDKQNEQRLEMAALLKSIAHPTRLAIIEALAGKAENIPEVRWK